MDKNKWTFIGLGLLILLVAGGLAWYYFVQPNEPKETNHLEEETPEFAEHVASYTENGVVSLYDVEKGTKVDEVDLKTRTPKIERTVEVEENTGGDDTSQEDCKCVDPNTNNRVQANDGNTELYKGYEKVTKPILKGQHVWGIQSELTPDINTIKLLPLLKELNKGQSLHPVKPNETRIFLQHPKKEVVVEPKKEEVTKKTVTKKVKDSEFIYFGDTESKTLYAYSNFANEVYVLNVADGKWVVETLMTVKSNFEADWLYVDKDHVWLADKSHSQVEVYPTNQPSEVVKLKAKGEMSKWHIDGKILHYTYDNRIASEELGKGEINDVVLGDNTLDFVFLQDKFYVLNSFGKNSDNSLLMKVNPKDLVVDDLIELESNQSAILSHGDKGNLYVGKIEKTIGLDGEVTVEPKVVSMDLTSKTLKEQTMKWELMYISSMMGWNEHLYTIEDKKLLIYPTGEEKPVKEFEVNGTAFSILP